MEGITNIPAKNKFSKQERLCSKKQMEHLFSKGASLNNYPIKLVYFTPANTLKYAAQAMFVVPKRNFKRAHDRNRIKRRMKEVYRINKNIFYESLNATNKKLIVAFIFTSKKEENYAVIESATKKLLDKVVK